MNLPAASMLRMTRVTGSAPMTQFTQEATSPSESTIGGTFTRQGPGCLEGFAGRDLITEVSLPRTLGRVSARSLV